MIWGVVYVVLVGVLLVRVRTSDAGVPDPVFAQPDEPVWLVHLHHGIFLVLLVGAPLEAAIAGGRPHGRLLGATAFALGVAAYRLGGAVLGDALSPLIEPRPGVGLVTRGPYRWLRHPMYLGQALIAVGAPLTLGCRWMLAGSVVAVVILLGRMLLEEHALARTFPEYARYAAETKRIVPFVY